jgi:cytochrome c553
MKLSRLSPAAVAALLAIAPAAFADIEQGKKVAAGRCFLCHGMNGESSSEVFPRLATQDATDLAKQLRDFQSGRRKGTTMNEMAKGLTEAEGSANLPRLAGQQALYLESQLKQLPRRERTNDNAVMLSIASKLTELEIKALSEYLASVP